MEKIIIDNDGGTDDFVAILYAIMSERFDVQGITLVAGNTDVENVRNNAMKALEMANVDEETAKKIGIHLPENINHEIVSDGAQGDNGLGGVNYSLTRSYETSMQSAEDKLIKTVNDKPGEITILATGPLTNIAAAIKNDPNFVQNVGELVIMGGDEGGGNITPYAEFNIYQDPEAAKTVFEAGFKKITMIGFNITKHVNLCPELEEFLKNTDEMGKFIYDITRVTAELDRTKNKVAGASMNDVLTAIYVLHPEFFKGKPASVNVNVSTGTYKGQTIIDDAKEGNSCNVIIEVERDEILREFLSIIFPDQKEKIEEALKNKKERENVIDELLKQHPDSKDVILEILQNENAAKFLRVLSSRIDPQKTITDFISKYLSDLKKRKEGIKAEQRIINPIGDFCKYCNKNLSK